MGAVLRAWTNFFAKAQRPYRRSRAPRRHEVVGVLKCPDSTTACAKLSGSLNAGGAAAKFRSWLFTC
jgi:hypothetical protein